MKFTDAYVCVGCFLCMLCIGWHAIDIPTEEIEL
jgi:hypothetical protein